MHFTLRPALFGFMLTALLSASSADAVTLNVVVGQLLGASDVNVGGTLYNVEFLYGTCVGLFSGCDETSDFAFQTLGDAIAASQALLDQVFLDGIAGSFTSMPELTRGCEQSSGCFAKTPYSILTGATAPGWKLDSPSTRNTLCLRDPPHP